MAKSPQTFRYKTKTRAEEDLHVARLEQVCSTWSSGSPEATSLQVVSSSTLCSTNPVSLDRSSTSTRWLLLRRLRISSLVPCLHHGEIWCLAQQKQIFALFIISYIIFYMSRLVYRKKNNHIESCLFVTSHIFIL